MTEEKKENNKKSIKNKSNDECIKNFNLAKDFFKGKLTIKEKDNINTKFKNFDELINRCILNYRSKL